jgi:hypothetical protein
MILASGGCKYATAIIIAANSNEIDNGPNCEKLG